MSTLELKQHFNNHLDTVRRTPDVNYVRDRQGRLTSEIVAMLCVLDTQG